MTRYLRFIFAHTGVLMLLLASGCDEKEVLLTEERKATILLSKPWEVGYVLLDGGDITDLGFLLMTLEFEASGVWRSNNSNGLFSASGTWRFADGLNGKNLNKIDFNGTLVDVILNPEGSTLTLRFERTSSGPVGGRGTRATGRYEIYLLPKFAPSL